MLVDQHAPAVDGAEVEGNRIGAGGRNPQGHGFDVDALAPGLLGRRSQVHIDLAWAYGQHRNDPATVLSLLQAERIAPEAIRFNVVARALLRECLKRERRAATPGLRGLASRVGILS